MYVFNGVPASVGVVKAFPRVGSFLSPLASLKAFLLTIFILILNHLRVRTSVLNIIPEEPLRILWHDESKFIKDYDHGI
jgi:hypothetical protein